MNDETCSWILGIVVVELVAVIVILDKIYDALNCVGVQIMKEKYLNALHKRYIAEEATARANLETYFNSTVAVAEHPEPLESMNELVGKIAEAEDKLRIIREEINELTQHQRLL